MAISIGLCSIFLWYDKLKNKDNYIFSYIILNFLNHKFIKERLFTSMTNDVHVWIHCSTAESLLKESIQNRPHAGCRQMAYLSRKFSIQNFGILHKGSMTGLMLSQTASDCFWQVISAEIRNLSSCHVGDITPIMLYICP